MSLSFDNSEAGCLLFYDCHRSVPAPFLTKTYHLVNDPATDEIVSWGEDHTTFVVWRPPEFARDLLPNYFKHNNFSSFVRQLNTYGFRKVVPDRWEFANDFFRRGERRLLCEIHRRKALQPTSGTGSAQQSRSLSPTASIEDQTWSPVSSPLSSPVPVVLPPHQNTTISIADENERLRKDNSMLLSEVSRLRRLYEETIKMVQHQLKGLSPDHTILTRIKGGQSLDGTLPESLSGDSAIYQYREPAGRREEIRELSLHVRTRNVDPSRSVPHALQTAQQELIMVENSNPSTASNFSFLSGKTIGVASPNISKALVTEETRCPLKLFGVPLNGQTHSEPASREIIMSGKKRHQPDSWEPVCDMSDLNVLPHHDLAFPRPPPRKCLKSELASEMRTSTVEAPWLQICAPRDEGVYI